jgi:LPS-assembly protein
LDNLDINYGDPNNTSGYIDMAGAGANSGLDKPRSDYVMRLQVRPFANFLTSARFRFNESTWQIMRTEVDTTLLYKRMSLTATYADYAERPLLGFTSARKGLGGAVGYKIDENWTFYNAARYDLDMNRFDGYSSNLNYLDECNFLSFQYNRAFYYAAATGGAKPPDDHRFLFRIGLRTVGDTIYSNSWLK